MEPVNKAWVNLRLVFTYRDSDGTGIRCRAAIALKRVNRISGNVEQVETIDSNYPPVGTAIIPVITASLAIRDRLNFDDYYYYVQITLQRTDTRLHPEAFGYAICGQL